MTLGDYKLVIKFSLFFSKPNSFPWSFLICTSRSFQTFFFLHLHFFLFLHVPLPSGIIHNFFSLICFSSLNPIYAFTWSLALLYLIPQWSKEETTLIKIISTTLICANHGTLSVSSAQGCCCVFFWCNLSRSSRGISATMIIEIELAYIRSHISVG